MRVQKSPKRADLRHRSLLNHARLETHEPAVLVRIVSCFSGRSSVAKRPSPKALDACLVDEIAAPGALDGDHQQRLHAFFPNALSPARQAARVDRRTSEGRMLISSSSWEIDALLVSGVTGLGPTTNSVENPGAGQSKYASKPPPASYRPLHSVSLNGPRMTRTAPA